MIHLEQIQREDTVQTTPVICMHCDDPACAAVCPADAIKKTPDGVVQSSLKPRCIGCSNCVFACPFGVPKYDVAINQMIKCDMCYDRTSVGKKPMCATVCPSQALFFGTPEEIAEQRGGVRAGHLTGQVEDPDTVELAAHADHHVRRWALDANRSGCARSG